MISYEDHPKEIRPTVTVSQFRAHMAHYIAMVRYGDDWVRIKRKGCAPVYLVSEADMKLIWKESDALYDKSIVDNSGMKTGYGLLHWIREGFRHDRGKG